MPRTTYEAELRALKENLLQLGMLVADAETRAVRALAERDEELAREVIASDKLINRLQREARGRVYRVDCAAAAGGP